MAANPEILDTPDTGVAYGFKSGTHDKSLTEVGPGTAMGELLRRYWQPVARSADATDTPLKIRMLGEDLILFRDKAGRPGLLYPNCVHRGTTLYYGRVEEKGIRCCYHGWLFDVKGNCVEQPCEPGGGKLRDKVRQPWYPVHDHYGLVFAYMGPPDRKPALPRIENLETLAADEELIGEQKAYAAGGPDIADCNWLQYFENGVDQWHVYILHGNFSGIQFTKEMAVWPDIKFEYSQIGVKSVQNRKQPDGKNFLRICEVAVPNFRTIPDPFGRPGLVERVEWTLPVDDTHFTTFTSARVKKGSTKIRSSGQISKHNGKLWEEMSEAEHRAFPNDREAHEGQGPIARHTEEHLASSDQGIAMFRRMLQKELAAVADGKDPLNVSRDANTIIRFESGNFA